MSWFRKSTVEKYEKGFQTKMMENHDVYHELNIRGEDPELLRTQVLEIVESMGYDIIINKFTKFETSEFDTIFKAGRLKPLRAVLYCERSMETGSMFPSLWKVMGFLGVLIALMYFTPQSFLDTLGVTIVREYFGILGTVIIALSIIFWYTRRIDTLSIWFKASGIYNVEDNNSDFKVIFSANTTSEKKKIRTRLNDDITELFRTISRKYVKKKDDANKAIVSLPKNSKDFDVSLIKQINNIDKDVKKLDARLARGEISEKVYSEVKENLSEQKNKLETLLDLVNV